MDTKSLIKKALSYALTLSLAFSAFGAFPQAVNAAGRFTNKVMLAYFESNNKFLSSLGNSLVTGNVKYMLHEKNYDGQWYNWEFPESGAYQNLYDSDISTQFMSSFHSWVTKSEEQDDNGNYLVDKYSIGRENGNYYYDIIYDLGNVSAIKYISVGSGNRLFSTGEYDLFASESENDLFSENNLVYSYNIAPNDAETPNPNQIYKIDGGINAKYVAIRIYNPYSTEDENLLKNTKNSSARLYNFSYIRLNEFNVYGTNSYSIKRKYYDNSNEIPYYEKLDSAISGKRNIIGGLSPVSAYVFRDGSKYTDLYELVKNEITLETSNKYPNFKALTDGSCYYGDDIRSNTSGVSSFVKTGANGLELINDESKMYYQFNYELTASARIFGTALCGKGNNKSSPYRYKISVADSEDKLFTKDASFTSDNIYVDGNYSEFIGADNSKYVGKYFGIRIISGCTPAATTADYTENSLHLRMSEIAVYGTYFPFETGTIRQYNIVEKTAEKSIGNATVVCNATKDIDGHYPAGSLYTVTAEPYIIDSNGVRQSFLYFSKDFSSTDPDNKIDSITATVTMADVASYGLSAVYGETDKTAKYTFLDKAGNIIYTADVKIGHEISRTDYEAANALLPEVPGYEKYMNTVSFGSRTAVMQMWDTDIYNLPASADITIKPIYNVSEKTYSINYGGTNMQCRFDKSVTFNASGNSVWYVNGVKTFYGSSYTFYVCGDMNITTSSGTEVPKISLYNPENANSATLVDGGIAAYATLNTEGVTVKECGVVYAGKDYLTTSDYTSGTYKSLTKGSAPYKITAKNYSAGGFMTTLYGVKTRHTRVIRGYVTYTISGGAEETQYSNIITVTP